jgi:hypothetical protein
MWDLFFVLVDNAERRALRFLKLCHKGPFLQSSLEVALLLVHVQVRLQVALGWMLKCGKWCHPVDRQSAVVHTEPMGILFECRSGYPGGSLPVTMSPLSKT